MEQNKSDCAGRRAALLLGGLVLLCVLGLAGCGGVLTAKQGGGATLKQSKLQLSGLWPDFRPGHSSPRHRLPIQLRRYRKTAIFFAIDEPYIDQAMEVLDNNHNSFAHELGLFDINEDGTPELMIIVYGVWSSGFFLYDLSGPQPLFLGDHWGPQGIAWTRQTEYGPAWRIDGNYSHGYQVLNASELFIPTENGLRVWWCGVDSSPVPVIPGTPVYWGYWVEQSLFEDGRTVFEKRREEKLGFPPDELLEDRAARDEEGKPPEEQLEEYEYPIAEMEERMAASLYRRLMEDDWVEVPPPWTTENDVYGNRGSDGWFGLDLRIRLRRLYEAWEEAHSAR